MQPQSVPMTTTLPGRIVPSSTAQVRPQVGGIITSVAVREGQPVEAGDLLFTINDQTYQAEVASAEANLASAEANLASASAQLTSAESKVSRYETLAGSSGVTQAELETAKVELAQGKASIQIAEAQL